MAIPKRKPATATYGDNWYTPNNLRKLLTSNDPKDKALVRKEYTRLRDIAQKRLKRLEAAGFDYTEAYKKNIKHYPKLSDIKSDYELMGRLSDLFRFILSKGSTVSGRKEIIEKTLSTLHEHGYTFVTNENLQAYGDFMEEYRHQKLDMLYDSGDAADLYGLVEKHKVDPAQVEKDFELWLDNLDEAKKLRYSKKSAGDYEKVKKRLKKRIEAKSKVTRRLRTSGSKSKKSKKSRKGGRR